MAMTPQEMIEVLQHFVDGGVVQSRHHDAQKWRNTQTPCWNFEDFDYRRKPKPLELWVNVPSNGVGTGTAFCYQATADACRASKERTVHMIEVLGD